MKRRAPAILGTAIGLTAALFVLGYGTLRSRAAYRPMLGDCGGPVQSVVLQYASGSQGTLPVFRQYLQWQSPDLTAYVACPADADFQELLAAVSPVKCRLVPVFTGHTQTAWSRDRWVALTHTDASLPVTLLSPKGEFNSENWPQRAGDSRIGEDLARAFPREFSARRSDLFFDGGDYLADGDTVFVTRALLERNLQHTVTTRDNLLQAIARDLHLQPVLLDDGPPHHAGMFMMAAGPDPPDPANASANPRRIMLVADPSLGKPLYAPTPEYDAAFTGGPDFSPATQKSFDAVAKVCQDNGYHVVRIPVVPAAQGKMYLTYVNVILDRIPPTPARPATPGHPAGTPVVYMSSYAGQEKLNTAAAAVWSSLGYEVRPIDCTSVWHLGGTLHCLVNVYRRQ